MNCKENKTHEWLKLILKEAGYKLNPLVLGYQNPKTGDELNLLDMDWELAEVNKPLYY